MTTSIAINLSNKEKYQCPICFNLMENSIQMTLCGHNICTTCYEKIPGRANIKICPLCRQSSEGFLDRRMKRELSNEIFKCPCGLQILFSCMSTHFQQCPKFLYECKFCDKSMILSEFSKHAEIYVKFFIKCHSCSAIVRREDLSTHMKFYCGNSETCVKIQCQSCPDKKEIPVTIFQRHYEREHLGSSETKVILPKICPEITIL